MTIAKTYKVDPVHKQYYGSLAEMLALSTAGLTTGDSFFAYNTYQSYHYAGDYGWVLWELHTVA